MYNTKDIIVDIIHYVRESWKLSTTVIILMVIIFSFPLWGTYKLIKWKIKK